MKVTLLGSGNVATHLGKALQEAGHQLIQIWSRTLANAEVLADELQTGFTDNILQLSDLADVYIIAVTDDSISKVASAFPFQNKLLVHTSGTTDLNIPRISGVLYPLQTFSRQTVVDFSVIPIIVEGKDETATNLLLQLARSLSSKAVQLNSHQRKALHIAAVFACNFSNHLYAIADEILKNNELEFDLLRPLIAETAKKIQENAPASVQTGPAVRNDQSTLTAHLQFLQNTPALRDLYERLSQSIINFD